MTGKKRIREWVVRGMPVFFVGFLWIGVWQMWPDKGIAAIRPDQRPFKTAYVSVVPDCELLMDPGIFAFDSPAAFRPVYTGSVELLRVPAIPPGRREFLGISTNVLKARQVLAVSGWSVWERKAYDLRINWGYPFMFGPGEQVPGLVFVYTFDLQESGFTVPIPAADELPRRVPGWEVRIMLDTDKEGRPKHVVIERGSGNRDIDDLVYRQVLLGRADAGREVQGGRVTVSFGL